MDSKKNILILYGSAGHGHEKAARAVEEAFLSASMRVKTLDTLKLTAPFFVGDAYKKSYIFMIKHIPWFWGLVYYATDVPWIYSLLKHLRRLANACSAGPLEKLLIGENPDAVISTHFMASEVAANLKRKGKIKSHLFTVITDYMPHTFWQSPADKFIVALPESKEALVRRGIAAESVEPLGIPTESKFSRMTGKEALAAKLKLDPKLFTVLLTSGGAGVGSVEKIVDGLLGSQKPMQILVVCGTNKELHRRLSLKTQYSRRLTVFGFVNNMDELMEVSDLVVGKGGGLTVTESLCKGKPLVLFESLPGQETRNARCLERHHAAGVARSAEEVVAQLLTFMEKPAQREKWLEGVRLIRKPNASQDLLALVRKMIQG